MIQSEDTSYITPTYFCAKGSVCIFNHIKTKNNSLSGPKSKFFPCELNRRAIFVNIIIQTYTI